jgi:hypothetical protein
MCSFLEHSRRFSLNCSHIYMCFCSQEFSFSESSIDLFLQFSDWVIVSSRLADTTVIRFEIKEVWIHISYTIIFVFLYLVLLRKPFILESTSGRKYLRCFNHRWNRSGFLTTGTGTGLNKSERTGPAGLPVWPVERRLPGRTVTDRSNGNWPVERQPVGRTVIDRSNGRPAGLKSGTGPDRTGPTGRRYRFHLWFQHNIVQYTPHTNSASQGDLVQFGLSSYIIFLVNS